MIQHLHPVLPDLYESDETAWLESMSRLIREGRLSELDYPNLCEYLSDMALRDKREVSSRLASLIAHLLKWQHQPERRTNNWRATIEVQRQELSELLESGLLHNHALNILPKAYGKGVRQAILETGLDESCFPEECGFSLEDLLSPNLAEE